MYAHGHLVTLQMATWVMEGCDQARATMVHNGFYSHFPRSPVHCRWMGRPAASGSRRAIFTVQHIDGKEVIIGAWTLPAGVTAVADEPQAIMSDVSNIILETGWQHVVVKTGRLAVCQ